MVLFDHDGGGIMGDAGGRVAAHHKEAFGRQLQLLAANDPRPLRDAPGRFVVALAPAKEVRGILAARRP